MTVAEFIKENADILIAPLTEKAFQEMTDGNVVFMLITGPGQKDITDRVIRSAGYYLTVSSSRNHLGVKVDQTVVGLTAGGYAKVESYNLGDVAYKGNKMIFLCKPLPQNDPRCNYKFVR